MVKERETVTVLDTEGEVLGDLQVVKVERVASRDHTIIVKVRAPREIATRIAGIRIQEEQVTQPMNHYVRAHQRRHHHLPLRAGDGRRDPRADPPGLPRPE